MKKITTDELKKIQMDILDNIDAFCRNNNLKYYICGGTLVGAIRHNGFIPWDDDIDIILPRKDYDRFISLYSSIKHSPYKLYCFELDDNFPYPFAKISDERTVFEEEINNAVSMGVNIDVFPLEDLPDDISLRKKIYKISNCWINILTLKRLPLDRRRGIAKNIFLFISRLFFKIIPTQVIVKQIIKNAQSYKDNNSLYVGVVVWGYGMKEIIKREYVSNVDYHPFEDRSYLIPSGYDKYLTNLYGNYMQLPPVEKRVSHHHFKAWWKE